MSGFYIDLEGQTVGPLSIEELREMYVGGKVNDETLFAKNGSVEWVSMRTIKPLLEGPKKATARPGEWLCNSCGHVGKSQVMTRGNLGTEILLWLVLIIPGVIYSFWRVSSRYQVCAHCGHGNIIPVESPNAQERVHVELGRWARLSGYWKLAIAAAVAAGVIMILRG